MMIGVTVKGTLGRFSCRYQRYWEQVPGSPRFNISCNRDGPIKSLSFLSLLGSKIYLNKNPKEPRDLPFHHSMIP
jgi:hypothetical protein